MRCNICELKCDIKEGNTGICRMYVNNGGRIIERFPDRYLFTFPISIETQPMLHFWPNSKFLQLSGIGCNFKCRGCISEVLTKDIETVSGLLKEKSQDEIIQLAKKENCIGLTWGINDPIVSYFSFKALAAKAKESDLFVGFSSNLYFTEGALMDLIQYVDFVNVGVKGYSDEIYGEICKVPRASVVFRNIELLYKSKVYFEVSIPYIKGKELEVEKTALFLSSLSKDIPLQVMRFIPFGEAELELEPTISEAESLVDGLKRHLHYVYLFNSPGTSYLDTISNQIEIKRKFYGPMGAHIKEYKVNHRHQSIFIGEINRGDFEEEGFFGGYRMTRATEIIIGILNAVGVYSQRDLNAILSDIITDRRFMSEFHSRMDDDASTLYDYLGTVYRIVDIVKKHVSYNVEYRFVKLKDYLEGVLKIVEKTVLKVKDVERVRAFYAMGHPLFALNGGRIECKLVEFAGCINTNSLIEGEGKPGIDIDASTLNNLNPDIVFISGFISSTQEEFIRKCNELKIDIKALKSKKVYRLPVGWDFGGLTWILGLMLISNRAYPQYFGFDLEREADYFFRTFYDISFRQSNKSFYFKKIGTV